MENTLENATKFFDEYTRHYRDNNPNAILNLPEVLVAYANELKPKTTSTDYIAVRDNYIKTLNEQNDTTRP